MIRIIMAERLAALRADAALVPTLRGKAEQADRARREADTARQAAEAVAAAARAARQQTQPARDATPARTRRSPAPAESRTARHPAGPAGARPVAGQPRQEIVRRHLARILTDPAPANHRDHLQAAHRDHSAESQQVDQVCILQLLFGHDEVAATYGRWLDETLREQVKTAVPLRSWDDVAIDSAPIGWGNRDRYGFLCACCGHSCWQVVQTGGDRLCTGCARRELGLEPGQVWAPRLPPGHHQLIGPGPQPGDPAGNSINVKLTDGTSRRYGLGDANPFLARSTWADNMKLTAAATPSGRADQPHLEVSGSTGGEGHQFFFAITLDFDPTPQGGHHQSAYGFRYTSGTLTTSCGKTRTCTTAFDLLATIARGETPAGTDDRQARSMLLQETTPAGAEAREALSMLLREAAERPLPYYSDPRVTNGQP